MAGSIRDAVDQTTKNVNKKLTTNQVLDLLDNSDIDLSDGENDDEFGDFQHDSDADPEFEPSASEGETDNSSDESDENIPPDASIPPIATTNRGHGVRGRPGSRRGAGGRGRSIAPERRDLQLNWANEDFHPQIVAQHAQGDQNVPPQATVNVRQNWTPPDYFAQYMDTDLFESIANATNQTAFLNTGRSMDVTAEEIGKFVGISIMMGCLKYPRTRMYWANNTGVSSIKQAMSRNRFFKIRSNLKVVVDINIPQDEKNRDKLWKVPPCLEKVRQTCLSLPRPSNICVDEQMIPFTGHVGIRQHIRGKPYPTGLKNFVLAAPSGEVLDLEIFQGKNFFPDADTSGLSIGGLAVLRLTQTVPPNRSLFVDRYFTSIPLLDCLREKGIAVTGTIMKNLVPRNAKRCLKTDPELKRQGRGSVNQIVREDQQVGINQWFDNKTVLSASTEFGAEPKDICSRWSKEQKAYIDVPRPAIIKAYNEKMGGVDLSDRMISYYRIGARTKKWTIRTVLHMVDLSLVNAWIQERQDLLKKGTQIKHLRQFLDFRLVISEHLLYPAGIQTVETDERPPAKRIALPPEAARRHQALHMPRFVSLKNAARCRHPNCKSGKSRVMCTSCNVFLCVNECFEKFHK